MLVAGARLLLLLLLLLKRFRQKDCVEHPMLEFVLPGPRTSLKVQSEKKARKFKK